MLVAKLRHQHHDTTRMTGAGAPLAQQLARGRDDAARELQHGTTPREVIARRVAVLARPDRPREDYDWARGGLDGARRWLAVVLCDWCDEHARYQLPGVGSDAGGPGIADKPIPVPDKACPQHAAEYTRIDAVTGNPQVTLLPTLTGDHPDPGSDRPGIT